MKRPTLLGTIKVVYAHADQTYKVIDGQHRLIGMRKILRTNLEWNMDIIVEVYDVKDTSECMEVYDLYSKANNNLNFKEADDPSNFRLITTIINAACSNPELCAGIVDRGDRDDKVYKPRILKKDLYEDFKNHFKIEDADAVNPQGIVNRIVSFNRQLGSGTIPYNRLFTVRDTARRQQNMEKGRRCKFFLNLKDSRFSPNIWIPKLLQTDDVEEASVSK